MLNDTGPKLVGSSWFVYIQPPPIQHAQPNKGVAKSPQSAECRSSRIPPPRPTLPSANEHELCLSSTILELVGWYDLHLEPLGNAGLTVRNTEHEYGPTSHTGTSTLLLPLVHLLVSGTWEHLARICNADFNLDTLYLIVAFWTSVGLIHGDL